LTTLALHSLQQQHVPVTDTVLLQRTWKNNVTIRTASVYHNSTIKGSTYSITERTVPELIPVPGSQPAGDALMCVINLAVGCHYFPPGLQPLRGLLPILLLGEQRHNGCEQFA